MNKPSLYTCFILATLFTFTLSCADANAPDKFSHIRDFFNGLFNQFGLFPGKIENCFCCPESYSQFILLGDYSNYIDEAATYGDFELVEKLNIKYQEVKDSLKNTLACIESTKEYQEFIEALNFTTDSGDTFQKPGLFPMPTFYFPKRFVTSSSLPMAIFQNHFSNNFYRSGELYGVLMKQIFGGKRNVRSNLRAFELFMNGMFSELELPAPKDIVSCFNQSTAINQMAFYYEWMKLSKYASVQTLALETIDFFQTKAEEITKNIPHSTIECVASSESQKQMTNKLGVDIHSSLYVSAFFTYAHAPESQYLNHIKTIHKHMEEGELFKAGVQYAKLMKDIVKTWEVFSNNLNSDIENL